MSKNCVVATTMPLRLTEPLSKSPDSTLSTDAKRVTKYARSERLSRIKAKEDNQYDVISLLTPVKSKCDHPQIDNQKEVICLLSPEMLKKEKLSPKHNYKTQRSKQDIKENDLITKRCPDGQDRANHQPSKISSALFTKKPHPNVSSGPSIARPQVVTSNQTLRKPDKSVSGYNSNGDVSSNPNTTNQPRKVQGVGAGQSINASSTRNPIVGGFGTNSLSGSSAYESAFTQLAGLASMPPPCNIEDLLASSMEALSKSIEETNKLINSRSAPYSMDSLFPNNQNNLFNGSLSFLNNNLPSTVLPFISSTAAAATIPKLLRKEKYTRIREIIKLLIEQIISHQLQRLRKLKNVRYVIICIIKVKGNNMFELQQQLIVNIVFYCLTVVNTLQLLDVMVLF